MFFFTLNCDSFVKNSFNFLFHCVWVALVSWLSMFMGDESLPTAASLRKSSLQSNSSSTTSLIEKEDSVIANDASSSPHKIIKQQCKDATNLNEIIVINGSGPIRNNNNNNNNHVISSMDHRNGTQDLTRYFNLRNFKRLSIFVIFVFIFYHGYLNSFYGK